MEHQQEDMQRVVDEETRKLDEANAAHEAVEFDELPDLTASAIIEKQDRVIKRIAVPEWGGAIYVRSMSSSEKEKYIASVRRKVGKGRNASEEIVLEESSAKLVQQTACDKRGVLLFSAAQVKVLAGKSAKAMQRVVDAAAELNGLDDEAEAESKNDSARQTASGDSNTD